jgi:C1A family cysteine protease
LYTLGVNRYSDRSKSEIHGFGFNGKYVPPKHPPKKRLTQTDLPKELDWRESNLVNPVRDQGTCGSCYSFASIAVVESLYKLHHGDLPQLSEQ